VDKYKRCDAIWQAACSAMRADRRYEFLRLCGGFCLGQRRGRGSVLGEDKKVEGFVPLALEILRG
jgi:hypothetical protein